MTARTPTVLLAVALTAALLAGCGSGAGTAPSDTSGTTAPSSTSSSSGSPSVAPATDNAIAGPVTSSAAPTTTTTTAATRTPTTTTTTAKPASFGGFVGTWEGHSRRLVLSGSGHVTITFRTYVQCSATVTTGCDRITGNSIVDGGRVVGHVGRVVNATTVQVDVDSTTAPKDFPARPFVLGHDLGHHALAARVGGFTDAPFCGSGAPSGYCGA